MGSSILLQETRQSKIQFWLNTHENRLPVRPVWDDGAAVGSGAVDGVVGYVGREQGRIQELLQGSRAPFLPTLMAD